MTKPTIEELEAVLDELLVLRAHCSDALDELHSARMDVINFYKEHKNTLRASIQQSIDIAKGEKVVVPRVPSEKLVNDIQDIVGLGTGGSWKNMTPQTTIRYIYTAMVNAETEEQK